MNIPQLRFHQQLKALRLQRVVHQEKKSFVTVNNNSRHIVGSSFSSSSFSSLATYDATSTKTTTTTLNRSNNIERMARVLQQPYSTTTAMQMLSSPFDKQQQQQQGGGGGGGGREGSKKTRTRKKLIPRKAAVQLTEKARIFFKKLLENNPEKAGVILNYHQASSGEPRMVFSFGFVNNADELSPEDEGVSLELLEDGSPKPPNQSIDDGLPKLYIHHNAFMKVLGATVDVDMENVLPILTDREGNRLDPNA